MLGKLQVTVHIELGHRPVDHGVVIQSCGEDLFHSRLVRQQLIGQHPFIRQDQQHSPAVVLKAPCRHNEVVPTIPHARTACVHKVGFHIGAIGLGEHIGSGKAFLELVRPHMLKVQGTHQRQNGIAIAVNVPCGFLQQTACMLIEPCLHSLVRFLGTHRYGEGVRIVMLCQRIRQRLLHSPNLTHPHGVCSQRLAPTVGVDHFPQGVGSGAGVIGAHEIKDLLAGVPRCGLGKHSQCQIQIHGGIHGVFAPLRKQLCHRLCGKVRHIGELVRSLCPHSLQILVISGHGHMEVFIGLLHFLPRDHARLLILGDSVKLLGIACELGVHRTCHGIVLPRSAACQSKQQR